MNDEFITADKILTSLSREPILTVETLDDLDASDLSEICDATEEAIQAGGGFGWVSPPSRSVLENYWRGVLLIPDRILIIGKLDHVIAGSCQILKPPQNNEAQAFSCQLTTFFLAPWARGYGMASKLVIEAENYAKSDGFNTINLDVRATQDRAIQSFETLGFTKIGTHPNYALIDGEYVPGYYFTKQI
ncbi:MAG: GNAT family N-acetyltransferase [Alphaproteobacteria bacterium]|jgi:ribosomal protein S18 acetylase RimI-like enzyme